jgi:Family of unknown function (DUF6522)
MTNVQFQNETIGIDASIVGEGLGLDASSVLSLMHKGEITSLCEQGVDEDAGRCRLTFFYKSRRFRIIVDETGNVIQRSTIDFGGRPLPAAMRKPGG